MGGSGWEASRRKYLRKQYVSQVHSWSITVFLLTPTEKEASHTIVLTTPEGVERQ